MRQLAVLLALAGVAVVGVDFLGDRTQNRPDTPVRGTRSEIVVQVTNRNAYDSRQEAAERLWAVCQGTVSNRLAQPGIVPLGGDRFRLVTEPAVGRYGWRRLKGCLDDLVLDQLRARVVSKRDVVSGPGP